MALRPTGFPIRALYALTLALSAASGTSHAWIIDGADVRNDQFGEVFALTIPIEDEEKPKLCTAVLVHPRVLVTSAHCLPADPAVPVTVREGADARAPIATYVSVRTERNPFYSSTKDETLATGFDFGIVILATDVAGANAKTGAKLAAFASIANPADALAARRDGVVVVGYGGNKTLASDATTGVKRWSAASIGESIPNAFTTNGPKAAVSRGDSGGPAYVLDRKGRRRLIGIASGAPKDQVSVDGLPSVSLYAGMRREAVCWIESHSGYPLPSLAGSLGCAEEFGAR